MNHLRTIKRSGKQQAGVTLIETMIALAILLVISIGILSMVMISITTTENQGHLAARTAEYAQDKMEQLMSLAFADGSGGAGTGTDTTVASFTPSSSGGNGLVAGGSITYGGAVSGYVDYLDSSGNPLGGGATAPAGWFYVRMWRVTDTTSSLKQIDVQVWARSGVNGSSSLPQSAVTSLKSSPF
jgi:type II secretory pathway pseudopilin PulG